MSTPYRLIGLDPGLRRTGWGVVDVIDNRCRHVANGTVTSRDADPFAERLKQLFDGLEAVIAEHRPQGAAVEETFVNKNPTSTLKLGQARGVVMLSAAKAGLEVTEYTPNAIKKAVVGSGHAAKEQIHLMVSTLLPGITITGPDAADALAAALCHAHHWGTQSRIAAMSREAAL